MELVGGFSAMEKSTRDSGSMAGWKAKESFSNKMALPIPDSGSITFSMATDTKNGPTGVNMRVTSVKGSKKVTES